MSYRRNSPQVPQPRQGLHSWRFYNDNFNVDRHHPFPPYSVQPPPLPLPPAQQNVSYINGLNQRHPQLKRRHEEKASKNPKQEKDETILGKVISSLDHYCDTSSLHGLKYVGENRFSKAERFFWLVAFTAAVIGAIYFISNLFIKYDTSPVIVNFSPEMINVQDMPFPAVTICNVNVAFKSRAEELKRDGSIPEQLVLDDLCDTNETKTERQEDYDQITWDIMQGVIRNVTQRCREMIVGCKWQGKTFVCYDLINAVITDDGYCCSFNKLPNNLIFKNDFSKPKSSIAGDIIDWYPESGYPVNSNENTYPFRAFGRGVLQGLTLVLDAALYEYYCSSINSFGFKVLLHSPRESPKIADLGFLVAPGSETRIAIDVDVDQASDSIHGIDYRKRKCFFVHEKFLRFYTVYNLRNCMLECEANYTVRKCGCTPFYLPRDGVTKICDKSDESCSNEARFVIERYGPEKQACDCLPSCAQIVYSPGTQSETKLMDINNITYTEFLGNYSQAYFAENMAILHIFFGADRYQVQVKTALYSFSEFLSNTGGLLGLFLGFSFLSVVEIVFFLFIRGPCVWCQNKRNHTKQTMFFQ